VRLTYISGSLELDGSSDYLSIPDSTDWDFGTGDFTIDFWMKWPAHGATPYPRIIGQYLNEDNKWSVYVNTSDFEVPNRHVSDTNTKLLLHFDTKKGYYQPTASTTMTLKSKVFETREMETTGKVVVFAEDENGDLTSSYVTAKISCNDGTNWTGALTLTDEGQYESDKHILTSAETSCATNGNKMKYELTVSDSDIRIHGVGLSWD